MVDRTGSGHLLASSFNAAVQCGVLSVQHQPLPSQPTALDGSVEATRQQVIRPCSVNHLQLPREVTAESGLLGAATLLSGWCAITTSA